MATEIRPGKTIHPKFDHSKLGHSRFGHDVGGPLGAPISNQQITNRPSSRASIQNQKQSQSHQSQSHQNHQILSEDFVLFGGFGITTVLVLGIAWMHINWGHYMSDRLKFEARRATGAVTAADWLHMGRICNTLGQYDCAADAFAAISRLDPNDDVALANLAVARTKMGEHNAAIKIYEKLAERRALSYDVAVSYGISLESTGASERAADLYKQTLKQNPQWIDIRDRLAGLLIANNRLDEAEALLEDFTHTYPLSKNYFAARKAAIEEKRSPATTSGDTEER